MRILPPDLYVCMYLLWERFVIIAMDGFFQQQGFAGCLGFGFCDAFGMGSGTALEIALCHVPAFGSIIFSSKMCHARRGR